MTATKLSQESFTTNTYRKKKESWQKKIIIKLETNPTINVNECLNQANYTLQKYITLYTIHFYCTYLTGRDNLDFETSRATKQTGYDPYFSVLKQTLETISPSVGQIVRLSHLNSFFTTFLQKLQWNLLPGHSKITTPSWLCHKHHSG